VKRALRIAGRVYLAGVVVMAAIIAVSLYKAPWTHGLSTVLLARMAAESAVFALLWPAVAVIIVLMASGLVTIE
jgi:hypothetical protein